MVKGQPGSNETLPQKDKDQAGLAAAKIFRARQDLHIEEEIRSAIEKETSIPETHKQNVQIGVFNGIAILDGQVALRQEKMTIGDKAVACAGLGHVLNHLVVTEEKEA